MDPTIIAAAVLVFFSTNATIAFDSVEACERERDKLLGQGIKVVCVQPQTCAPEKISALIDNITRMQIETERRRAAWAKTGKAWCWGLKYLDIDPADKTAWPHGKKPGPCPDF